MEFKKKIIEMSEGFHSSDREFETPTTLVTSLLFQCNLFKLVNDGNNDTAQCLVCKKNGMVRYCKGKTTSNYHLHMKRMHAREYEEYLTVKNTGIPRFLIPFEEDTQSDDEIAPPRVSPLFEHGFFEICMYLSNKNIKANCMTCQRMGRPNLIQAREDSSSNLFAHLKRMHPAEYERYLTIKEPKQQSSLPTEMDVQQSVVSTIKSEDLEFVEVNQDEIPGETWDSFESSDFFEQLDTPQAHAESAATSTTKTIKMTSENDDPCFESGAFNDNADSNDESNEYNDSNRKRAPLLFRGGFFRYLKKDGVTVRAECLNCKYGNVYSGHMWSSSNFIKHLSRMHPKQYERFLAMKEEEKLLLQQDRHDYQSRQMTKFEQSDFNRIVLNFMISGMHHPSLLEDPSFDTLLNDIASKRTADESSQKLYHIISPLVLNAEIAEQLSANKESIQTSLKDVLSVSLAVDAWSVHQKTFLVAVVNWVDSKSFQRVSNVINCSIFPDPICNEILVERLHQTYTEYGITNKIVATVTNNNRQHEKVKKMNEITYLEIEGLENHIKNPTYFFEMIGSKHGCDGPVDDEYDAIYATAFEKFDALHKHATCGKSFGKVESILNGVFNHPSIGSKVTEIYNSVSNLVNCDSENLNEISNELGISTFTENEINFLKEYAIILEPIATAIEYLQKNNCFYATLLPMVYSMRDNLMDVKNQGKIQLCQSLLTTILNDVEQTFQHLFDLNDEKCVPAIIATCTHPFFKMRWLKGDLKTPTNTNQILDLLVRVAKEYDVGIKKENTDQQASSIDEKNPPEKKFKFSFDTSSNEESNDETMIQMDFMSFLKKPCQNDETNLEELKQHPWVQKLFVRYNSIISSAAALERSIPLFDLIGKSQSGQFTDELFCKLGLLRKRPT